MSDTDNKKEIRRMRMLLQKMAAMAEHVEQTGSFESGISNSVKRYNNIVEHLEEIDAIPEDLFPRLEDDADSGQLGAEATLLGDYLNDLAEEEEPAKTAGAKGKWDIGMMVALAPFLDRGELSNIVRKHFSTTVTVSDDEANDEANARQGPDLKTIVGLAPHVDQATLYQMVRACLAAQPLGDPKILVALAPHLNPKDFSQLIREYLPTWFGAPMPPTPPTPPTPPIPPAPPTPPTPAGSWGMETPRTEELR